MQTPLDSRFRLGFDGGGTKTRAVVIDANHQVLGAGESGASNPYALGIKAALDNIEIAADLALQRAQLGRDQIAGWGMGLGGVCSALESAEVEIALRERVGPKPKIVAMEDVVAAWSGAFGGQASETPRAVCIAGTGANCWGKNARGETASADGAGPLLGDRGSGYWIGEAALRYAARACDGIVERDEFAAQVLSHFGCNNINQLIRLIYAPDFARSRIAGLVPVVLQYAEGENGKENGNRAARAILSGAGRELAMTSLAVLQKLNAEEIAGGEIAGGEIALIGGVLAHAVLVKATFVQVLQERAPQICLVEARFEPAVGAAILS